MAPKIGDCLTHEGRRILKQKIKELDWDDKNQKKLAAAVTANSQPPEFKQTSVQKVLARTTLGKEYIKQFCEAVGFTDWEQFIEPDPRRNCNIDDRPSSDESFQSDRTKLDPYNIPLQGSSHFVGRTDELDALNQALFSEGQVAITALEGMGGVGKTELAIQYTKQFKELYPGGICWISVRDFYVGPQIVAFAHTNLKLRIPEGMELPDQLNYCWRNWIPGNVLIVLDDVTDFNKVKPHLPYKYLPDQEKKRFKTLITTRLDLLGDNISTLLLEVLTPENALELLISIVGKDTVDENNSLKDASELCEWLGNLPLGLELVGYYLVDRRRKKHPVTFSKMLTRLKDAARINLAIKHESLSISQSLAEPITAQLGVEAAFNLSWKELSKPSQHLGKKLGLCADSPIPRTYILEYDQTYREMYPEDIDLVGEDLEDAIIELMNFHLLQLTDQENYLLHSLILQFFRSKLEMGE